MPNIKLQSSDGDVFEVDVQVASCSKTIETMIDNLGINDGDDDDIVPLQNVDTKILKMIIEWATHHKDDPPPPEDEEEANKAKRNDDIGIWDSDFLKVDLNTTFELILAANFLDIKGLFDLTCKAVANMCKGKKVEQIRDLFNIVTDLTPEQVKQIQEENEWVEGK